MQTIATLDEPTSEQQTLPELSPQSPNLLLQAALGYATCGWPVFPVFEPLPNGKCSCGKPDCPSPGKHPRVPNGLKDGTINKQQIQSWWSRWPSANIAVPTGAPSGLAVLDVDRAEPPDDLQAATLVARTGAGWHYYFQLGSFPAKSSAGKLGNGVDLRGDGAYIIVPPSRHANGATYRWIDSDETLQDAPAWLLSTNPIVEGERNDCLYKMGSAARGKGKSEGEILDELLLANSRRCVPPLDDAEVEQIARGAAKYQPNSSSELVLVSTTARNVGGILNLDQLRARLTRWLSIPDEDTELIDFCLSVYKSHEIPGDPLWGILIDASGGGKTELLRAFRNRPDAFFLSKLTENSLVSGYRDPNKPIDPSLLLQLKEKVLVIKDLAPLLSMRRESRNAIIADLRDAYDGFTDQARGNIGKVSYEARFTLLAASTLAIERGDTVDQELGERFIKFRARGNRNAEKVRKAVSNIGVDGSMRQDVEESVSRFLASLPRAEAAAIPEVLLESLIDLADFTATARSSVARDRNGVIEYLPRPEVGTRLGKELGKLLLALAIIRGKTTPDSADLATTRRVAEDCLPPNRLAVISVLRGRGPLRMTDIESATGLPHSTVARTLEDLRVLGLASRTENADKTTTWEVVARTKPAP
jgi:hypothetical protein